MSYHVIVAGPCQSDQNCTGMSGIVCKIIAYMGLGSELAAFLPYLFAKEGLEGARWMTGRTSLPQSVM